MPKMLRRALDIAVVATGLLVLGMHFLAYRFPSFELITNFRLQLFVVLLLLLAILLLTRVWSEAIAIGVLAMIVGASVVPYLRAPGNPASPGEVTSSILQYNVLDTNEDYDGIIGEVLDAEADIVALHELTSRQWLAIEGPLSERYPYSIAWPSSVSNGVSRGGGKALLSIEPLTLVPLDPDLQSPIDPPLAATTRLDGRKVLAIALHPSPSRTGAQRIYQRQTKLRAAEHLAASYGGPVIIIADLNITPTSPQYANLLEKLDWPDPRKTVGLEPTYFVRGRSAFGVAIDHVLLSPEFEIHRYDTGDGGGSDHRSLVATVSWAADEVALSLAQGTYG
jgi:endonuclease/exonuclease/phosphatase (EEP) superfamily protein YafD